MPEPDTATALYVSITQTTLLVLAIIGVVCWLLGNPEPEPLPVDESW